MSDAASTISELLDALSATAASSSVPEGDKPSHDDPSKLLQRLKEAVLSATPAVATVPPSRRLTLWTTLLLGNSARPDLPDAFAKHVRTSEANDAAIESDVELAVAGANSTSDDAQAECRGIIEYFCVKTGFKYEPTMAELLTPLLSVAEHHRGDTPAGDDHKQASRKNVFQNVFGLFFALQTKLVPHADVVKRNQKAIFELLRLILQYHDPELSIHLDRQMAAFGPVVVFNWVVNLFVTSMRRLDDVVRLWDLLLAFEDPGLAALFFSLARLQRQRASLLQCHDTDAVTRLLHRISAEEASAMTGDGGGQFLHTLATEARQLLRNTPFSARALLRQMVFSPVGLKVDTEAEYQRLLGFVALPITAEDLTAAFAVVQPGRHRASHISHVVLDCRAERSFHAARLPTAIHVGNDVGFDPTLLNGVVQRFDHAKGSHLCLLGTGRGLTEEGNLLKVLALHFVSAGFPYVSVVEGGFKSVIPLIKNGSIEFTRSTSVTPNRPEPPAAAPSADASPPVPPSSGNTEAARTATESATTATTAAVAAKFAENIKHKLADIKTDEVKAKAAAGLSTAKSWGLSVVKGLGNAWSGTAKTAESAGSQRHVDPTHDATLHNREEVVPSPMKNDVPAAAVAHAPSAPRPATTTATAPKPSAAVPAPVAAKATNQVAKDDAPRFALPEDDDDDGLDLITSVPPSSHTTLPSTAPVASSLPGTSKNVAPPAAAVAVPKSVSSADDLFGDDDAPTVARPTVPAAHSTPSRAAVATHHAESGESPAPTAPPLESKPKLPSATPSSSAAPVVSSSAAPASASSSQAKHHPFDDIFV